MTDTQANRLQRWRLRFQELDACPWPGPRPLRGGPDGDGAHLLIGRDADRTRFRAEVDRHRLVWLTGPSGVGKTSLIEAGLVPELRDRGDYVVALCRDWSGGGDAADPLAFLVNKVARGLEEGGYQGEIPADPNQFFLTLNHDLPDRLVLVFDQFEELLRDATQLAEQLFPFLIALNHETSIRVVLSFRSEHLNELKTVENQASPFSFAHFDLAPVDADHALEIVLAGNHDGVESVDPSAADAIARAWRDACGHQTGGTSVDRYGRIGLLHLQALLYALHGAADGAPLGSEAVDLVGRTDPIDLFGEGMRRAIDLKLDRCRHASMDLGLDSYLIEGTAGLVARSAGHLSSVGYKLVRGATDLWASAVGDDTVDRLQTDDLDAKDLVIAVTNAILPDHDGVDLLDATRAQLVDQIGDDARAWAMAIAPPPDLEDRPSAADPRGVSCGPMSGLPPAATLVEEARRFAFALEWLQASSLARLSTPGRRGATISLIHDGFGAALERWSSRNRNLPATALAAIVAPSGATFVWQEPGDPVPAHPALDGDRGAFLLANLRWNGAWVQATFRNLTFVNCDLRGAGFHRCTFTGVSFVNCLLDGCLFSECTVIGAPEPPETGYETEAPEYRIDAPADLLAALSHYRGLPAGTHLLSPRPGLPAVPAVDPERGTAWHPPAGGLCFFGGRVSSMVFRSLEIDPDAGVALRDVAGSGMDIVEQSTGSFEISGSSIRHLSITAPVTREGSSPTPMTGHEAPLHLSVDGSALAQAWFGAGLAGKVRFRDCSLFQIWNGSVGLDATASESAHFDLVNVEVDDTCPLVDALGAPAALEHADPGGEFMRTRAAAMDYVRNPAEHAAALRRTTRS